MYLQVSDLQEITGLFNHEAIQVIAEAYDVALDVSFQKGTEKIIKQFSVTDAHIAFFEMILIGVLYFYQEMMEVLTLELLKLDKKKNSLAILRTKANLKFSTSKFS